LNPIAVEIFCLPLYNTFQFRTDFCRDYFLNMTCELFGEDAENASMQVTAKDGTEYYVSGERELAADQKLPVLV